MVLPKATLTDTLIEGGLTPDAAQRTAEMIALGYDEVAKQGEVERRFTEVDRHLDEQDRLVERRLDEQDRLNDANLRRLEETSDTNFRRLEETSDGKFKAVDANFKTVEAKIAAVDTRVTDLRAELLGRIQDLKDDMDAKFAAAKDSVDKQFAAVHQRIDDLKSSTDRQFRVLMWMIGLGVAAFIGIAAAVISLLLDILSRLP